MTAKKLFLLLAMVSLMALPAGLAQATQIPFGGAGSLLGTGGLAAGTDGSANLGYNNTTRSLNSYGLSGVSVNIAGYSWYGSGTWPSSTNPDGSLTIPGGGSAQNLWMTEYRNQYGLAVGTQASGTGVNELDAMEGVVMTFTQPIYLSSVTIGNFYDDNASSPGGIEKGWMVIDGNFASPIQFTSSTYWLSSNNDPGNYVISLPSSFANTSITSIAFFAASTDPGSDYVIRSVDATRTPEPASLVLMGSAAGLMWWRRRRQS